MDIQMSNFDNFDIVQISSKFAQRYHFVCNFNCKIFSILSSLDNAENAWSTTFYESPNILFWNNCGNFWRSVKHK